MPFDYAKNDVLIVVFSTVISLNSPVKGSAVPFHILS
jgi:hypothetical protein